MMKWNEMWPREETKRGGESDRFEAMRYGLLADAARTLWVMVTWAFELLGGWAARSLGARTAFLPSGVAAEPADERVPLAAEGQVIRGTEPGAPMTLRELGLPRDLASEFEAVFRLMGRAEGDLVAGYVFLAPDGVRHPVRLAPANGPGSPPGPGQDLAA
jgi:hypothetical protein